VAKKEEKGFGEQRRKETIPRAEKEKGDGEVRSPRLED
jgi:hypothetical protein